MAEVIHEWDGCHIQEGFITKARLLADGTVEYYSVELDEWKHLQTGPITKEFARVLSEIENLTDELRGNLAWKEFYKEAMDKVAKERKPGHRLWPLGLIGKTIIRMLFERITELEKKLDANP